MVVVVVVDGANVGAVTTVVLLLLPEFLETATPIPTQHPINTLIKQIVPMVNPIPNTMPLKDGNIGPRFRSIMYRVQHSYKSDSLNIHVYMYIQ